jgi:hypothetical protein
MSNAREIVDNCNALARQFYRMHGCEQPDDYKFYEATHPIERGCWNMAVLAYDHIEGTCVDDCLAEVEDDDGEEPCEGRSHD